MIRPVAEYAWPVWHSSLTIEQSNRIESFQKRALKIIYNDFTPGDNAYDLNCIVADLPQLADRREQLQRQFVKMADTDNCLNYARRDSEIIYLVVLGQQKSTHSYMQSQRGLTNDFFLRTI